MLGEAAALVGQGYRELFDSLNGARGERNLASYIDPEISFQTLQATRLDARELLELAEMYVADARR